MTVRTFRGLLILSVVLPIVGVLFSMATQDRLPEPLREYAIAQSSVLPPVQSIVGCLILLTAWVAAVVGAYRFKPYGRWLFFIALVAGLALTPTFGPYIDSGWAQLFYQASFMMNGVVLALMYCSSLQENFRKQSAPLSRVV